MTISLIASAALAALIGIGVSEAAAQQQSSVFGPRASPPRHGGPFGGGHNGGRFRDRHLPGFILVEREVPVVIEREVVVREVAPAASPTPPPAPRKPYVVGQSYASLPGGCMKMIEGTASYYYCGGGEWYRPVGKQYKAIARP